MTLVPVKYKFDLNATDNYEKFKKTLDDFIEEEELTQVSDKLDTYNLKQSINNYIDNKINDKDYASVFDSIVGVYPFKLGFKDVPLPFGIKNTILGDLADSNKKLKEKRERLIKQGNKAPPVQHFAFDENSDPEYVYKCDGESPTGNWRRENVSNSIQKCKRDKKVSKILAKTSRVSKKTELLKEWQEFKTMRNLIEKDEDFQLVISTNPIDILRKSTDQNWTSCEMLGHGCAGFGPYSDIEHGNAIAYLTHSNNTKWLGRVMLRHCDEGGYSNKPNIGIEPVFYPHHSDIVNPISRIRDIIEEKNPELLDYNFCVTPYEHGGYADQMAEVFGNMGLDTDTEHSIDTRIIYGPGAEDYVAEDPDFEDLLERDYTVYTTRYENCSYRVRANSEDHARDIYGEYGPEDCEFDSEDVDSIETY